MHVVVATEDEWVLRLFRRLLQEEHSDWTVTTIHRPYPDNDTSQFIATLPTMDIDLLIVQEHNGLLWNLARTAPHPFPIIGCTSSYTPDVARHLQRANIIPVATPYSIDAMVELINTTVALQR